MTSWTVARQVSLSMGFSRQEHWSGLPCPLQGIFPTQGSNLGLPHCRQILYCQSHQGNPKLLKWVAWSFSRGSSQPRNRLHCRWILYQLSYQGSPNAYICLYKCQNGIVSVGHRDRERTGRMTNFDFVTLCFHYLYYACINFPFGKKKRLMN